MDSGEEINLDFLRNENRDDIKLYEEIQNNQNSGELNYFGFDAAGCDQSLNSIFSRKINPYATLLRNHNGPIKRNYKLEKVYEDALSQYEKKLSALLCKPNNEERELQNLLIKLYALEENEPKKTYYKNLLLECNKKCDLGLSKILVP